MRDSVFQVCQVEPRLKHMTQWLIIETVWTSEGPRSRVCHGRWNTPEEAYANVDKRVRAALNNGEK